MTEKKIRSAVITKADPHNIRKTGKHWSGALYVGDSIASIVKIPNSHCGDIGKKLASLIARSLLLKPNEFNKFVNCTLDRKEYQAILKSRYLTQ
jgi:hypothetical protein